MHPMRVDRRVKLARLINDTNNHLDVPIIPTQAMVDNKNLWHQEAAKEYSKNRLIAYNKVKRHLDTENNLKRTFSSPSIPAVAKAKAVHRYLQARGIMGD